MMTMKTGSRGGGRGGGGDDGTPGPDLWKRNG